LAEALIANLDFNLHDHAPILRIEGYVPTEKGGRPRFGALYQKNSLAEDFREVRTLVFGKGEKRQLMDMRRTGSVESNAGGASVESISAKLGNSIVQNKTLQRTYMPVITLPLERLMNPARSAVRSWHQNRTSSES
jgi:hypothetical protein